jgi:predicted transcriptional regulator
MRLGDRSCLILFSGTSCVAKEKVNGRPSRTAPSQTCKHFNPFWGRFIDEATDSIGAVGRDTLKRVDGIARAMSRSRAWVINEAIERYLDYEEWGVDAVKRELKEAETGELVEHEAAVRRWVSKREAKVDARR